MISKSIAPLLRTAPLLLALAAPAGGLLSAQPPAPSNVPFVKKHIYSVTANPRADIAAAISQARKEHRRIILDFGGDWCGDCHVLDIYFHQSPNAQLLAQHFDLLHIDIAHIHH